MKALKSIFIVLCIGLAFNGCASKYMQPVDSERELSYEPSESEAVIIFMRPSAFGGAIQSSVFDVTNGDNILVGIVSSKAKVAHKTAPGEHTFMVVGESADFMGAEVEAGKKYYALVTPRFGAWKARFSLKPIHKDELESDKLWNGSAAAVLSKTPIARISGHVIMLPVSSQSERRIIRNGCRSPKWIAPCYTKRTVCDSAC